MRRVGARAGLIVAVIALGVGTAACGRAGGGSRFATSFGHMAGYVWSGRLRSVAAAWAVPRMTPGSGEAHASTWIGAQARGPSRRSPFIQVGTVEDRGAGGPPAYAAFWTDTARGFHPQILFRARPGDLLAAALVLAGGRWQVSIRDTTSDRLASFSTSEEGAGSFSLAEWLQEDPVQSSGRLTRYPRLSTVRMSGLVADGAPPAYADMYAQWMSLGGGDLAPTEMHRDAFSIVPAQVSAAGERYLAITRPRNLAAARIDAALQSFSARTPRSRIIEAGAAAAATERTYAARLARGHWPATAARPIHALAGEVRREAAVLQSAGRRVPFSVVSWRAALAALTPALETAVHRVRRALHLPEIVAGQPPRSGGAPRGSS